MNAAPVLAQSFLEGNTTLFQYEIPLPPWEVILLLAAAGAAFNFLLRSVLKRLVKGTATALDDILVDISAKAVPFWILLSILFVVLEIAGESQRRLQRIGGTFITVAFILSLFWFVSALVLKVMENWALRNEGFRPAHPPLRFVLRAGMTVIGGLTVLTYLGVQVVPLLATLGVGGLAVALALRDTLENFFAGLHIMADRPLAEGDTILIHETGDTGVVMKVGWRSTRIRNSDNNILVVPNLKLSSGIVTNLSAQDASVFVRIQVGVAYGSDADRVREVLLDEVRAAAPGIPGLAAAPAPEAWLHPGFGPSSLDFTIRVAVERADLSIPVQDALRRAILRRLGAEGIAIPFPTTTVEIARKPRS